MFLGKVKSFLPWRSGTQMKHLYSFVVIRWFAVSIIILFEPIYLYNFFEQAFSHGLALVMFFYALVYILAGLFMPWGGELCEKWGVKHMMLFSTPFLLIYYASVLAAPDFHFAIIIALIANFIYKVTFWPAFHIDFTGSAKDKELGRETGLYRILRSIATILGPILGGFIIANYSYTVVFIVVLVLLAVAFVPLFWSPEIKNVYTDTYRSILNFFTKKKGEVMGIVQGTQTSIFTLNKILWPILLFLLAIDFDQLGAIASGGFLVGIAVNTFVAKKLDTSKGKTTTLTWKLSNLFIGATLIFKGFVSGIWSALIADVLYNSGYQVNSLSYGTFVYKKAREGDGRNDEYIVKREVAVDLMRGFLMLVLGGLFYFNAISLSFAFVLVALMTVIIFIFK